MSRYLIDSYGWIEAFTNGPKAKHFTDCTASGAELISCGVVLAEIAAKFHRGGRGDEVAPVLASIRQRTKLVEIDEEVADLAGRLWAEHHRGGMGLAGAIILAVATKEDAIVLTGDLHFKGLKSKSSISQSGVGYFRKKALKKSSLLSLRNEAKPCRDVNPFKDYEKALAEAVEKEFLGSIP
ncbi:MAG: PIN domain-containing protein [Candidatus Micrarchaeota archaeon]